MTDITSQCSMMSAYCFIISFKESDTSIAVALSAYICPYGSLTWVCSYTGHLAVVGEETESTATAEIWQVGVKHGTCQIKPLTLSSTCTDGTRSMRLDPATLPFMDIGLEWQVQQIVSRFVLLVGQWCFLSFQVSS